MLRLKFHAVKHDEFVVLGQVASPYFVTRSPAMLQAEGLLLTGRADAMDPSAAMLVDGILKKPFDLDDLTGAVVAALAGRS